MDQQRFDELMRKRDSAGLSQEEATAYVQGYGHDYFRRFDDKAGG